MQKYLTFLLLTLAFAGCNQHTDNNPRKSAIPPPPPDTSPAGDISGIVSLRGTPPPAAKIDMGLDPACNMAAANLSEQVVAKEGKLANVYIFVKSGLTPHSYSKPNAPVVITQKGCRYIPHVLAARTGQVIRVLNEDPAMHNIHPAPKISGNREWNVSQMPKGEPIERTFDAPEVMMPVKCNQHPWMKMYLNINDTPFFDVSAADGSFKISGLPAGDYVIAAVHEKYGEQDQTVHLNAKQTKAVEFVFTAQ